MLKTEHLCTGYGRKEILHDVSLSFPRGQVTSVIGPNGSGKSTLLKALTGLLPITGGSILADGQDCLVMPRSEKAKKIAYLPQGYRIPDMTVGQLVLHGRYPHTAFPHRYGASDHGAAMEAMERMGISHLSEQPLSSLSGGMAQTAFLAMALAQDASYILLDEPTTYLDLPHQLSLMRLLRALAEEGRGVGVVMHDLPMAFTCSDGVAVMNNGAVLLYGSPEEMRGRKEISELFGASLCCSEEAQQYYCSYSFQKNV